MFLHFVHRGGKSLEWGFDRGREGVPAVGDIVWLGVGIPDNESPENWLAMKVVSREWIFNDDYDEDECFMEVETNHHVDGDFEADSEVWPLRDHTKRQEALRERIKNTLRDASS